MMFARLNLFFTLPCSVAVPWPAAPQVSTIDSKFLERLSLRGRNSLEQTLISHFQSQSDARTKVVFLRINRASAGWFLGRNGTVFRLCPLEDVPRNLQQQQHFLICLLGGDNPFVGNSRGFKIWAKKKARRAENQFLYSLMADWRRQNSPTKRLYY